MNNYLQIKNRSLASAGLLEIFLFGLPLVLNPSFVGRYVRCYDPHIFKEYGVARIALGGMFLLGSFLPQARSIARVAALYYAANFAVSLADLKSRNVELIELGPACISAGLCGALTEE